MAPAAEPAGLRLTLARRLALAVCLLAALFAALLLLLVAPGTEVAFERLGADLLRDGSTTMHELARAQTAKSNEVLVDLIRHNAKARERAVQDLPLEALGGDVAAIRAAVLDEDNRRAERQQRNVGVLAREMQARVETAIATRLHELDAAQRAHTEALVAELRTTHVALVAVLLVLLLTVLAFGLHRLVVAPTRRLRLATQRVAAGELTVDLPPAAGDEIGDLARDFAAMVAKLRSSRAELQRLAAGLEHEVARKTAELRDSHRQLAQAERLAALGTLAGGIAHEFHNVIGGIRGCAQELAAGEADGDRRETLAVITRAADRGTSIVQQLLRFARRSVDRTGDVDVAAIADDALRLCEPAARRQDVRVERSLQPGLQLRGDADGLHQVCVNLLVNALQAMPDGGTLKVAVAGDEREVMLTVADTGTGISPDDLPHVFEPFFTTRTSSADPQRRGSGLGLSVSYGIVTAHRGSIHVDSRLGSGTTFTVRLPRGGAA